MSERSLTGSGTSDRESMTAQTQHWDARTSRAESLTASAAPWLSQSALAARSMHAVERIADTEARRAGFAAHMAAFPPTIGRL